ncbi:unnamed protein product [Rotaria sp. Silwood1]|nr:unnamed protein product [Rotaria sp. Silwood1]CAF0755603.1 unnamed protein product [Rotaria sp. Silwood1]CAF3330975.1 unnamed protein product [Rotaria sp. Silwood1]CAF4587007.1 unnamed protein product [Rotaria sp. Silwood1]
MDSISNSGVSLILNPDIANVINDNQHQHDLSTCEEEFENQEEIQQVVANAFDSQSLSNTDNDEHAFDDDDDDDEQEGEQLPVQISTIVHVSESEDSGRLQQENEILRHRITANEEIYRKNTLEYEYKMNELNEKYEQKFFSLRLEYETKIEQLTNKTSEQQIEMLTLKQMYETIYDEKCHVDERINDIRLNEQNLQEKLDKIQTEYEQLLKLNKKSLMISVLTQTETNNEMEQQIETLTKQNIQLVDELTRISNQLNLLQTNYNEREQFFSNEKIQYEKHIKELSKRPTMSCIKLQTDFINDDKKVKQLQNELEDHKLKLNSKQMEINSLTFDLNNLKQEMNDRLSLLTTNVSNEKLNKILFERDQYLNELNKLKIELPDLKQQMIDSFQTKVITFKEQVKKSLVEKENDYKKKIEQIENEYISQYEQVLEKNKQIVRSLIASKQEEFNTEKARIISEYEEKLKTLQTQQLPYDERHIFKQKIEELTCANNKYSQYIAKREQEHRQREKLSLNFQQFDETKRKYNDEIHRLYDQIAKQNQQQILLIDEHQKQIEQLKNTYDQRYRILLDEWKIYNNDLHDNNTKLKTKLKEYEKTIVQLRYHIINLQIEYLQNGGNSNKILQLTNDIK